MSLSSPQKSRNKNHNPQGDSCQEKRGDFLVELLRVFAETTEISLTPLRVLGKIKLVIRYLDMLRLTIPPLLPLRRLVYQVARLQVASLSLELTLTIPIFSCYP